MDKIKKPKLSEYIQLLQSNATYVFRQYEAHKAIGGSYDSIKLALHRLLKKRRIVRLYRGLFAIVPIEYYTSGSPPPDWLIDDLMKFHQQPYYVAILTACALHGAAHQQPHEFQVITNQQLRPILIGQWQIKFYTKTKIEKSSMMKLRTYTGYMDVSTPEATAFDLVRCVKASGYLQNSTTVLLLQRNFTYKVCSI